MQRLVAAARAAAILAGALAWQTAAAAPGPDLYGATAIVTGTDTREREEGLRAVFETVAIRLTGDPALAGTDRLSSLAAGMDGMVQDILYLDRETDEVHHDEQGTRDRPFFLLAHLDPEAVDRALASAGMRIWRGPRPVLFVLVRVEKGNASFQMTADGVDGERQRQALATASARYGIRVAPPLADELNAGSGSPPGRRGTLERLKGTGPVQVAATLTWSEADFGWVGRWTMADGGRDWAWEVRGVSFDEAFRSLVGGAASRLSAGP